MALWISGVDRISLGQRVSNRAYAEQPYLNLALPSCKPTVLSGQRRLHHTSALVLHPWSEDLGVPAFKLRVIHRSERGYGSHRCRFSRTRAICGNLTPPTESPPHSSAGMLAYYMPWTELDRYRRIRRKTRFVWGERAMGLQSPVPRGQFKICVCFP